MNLLHSLAMVTHKLIYYSVKIRNRDLVIYHGENLELGIGFRVLVLEERKRMESWVKRPLDWSS